MALVEAMNSEWKDLFEAIKGCSTDWFINKEISPLLWSLRNDGESPVNLKTRPTHFHGGLKAL